MKLIAKVVAVALLCSLVLIVPAEAISNVTTHLKMKPSRTSVPSGELVKFKVTLSANKKKCRQHMPIKLLKNGNFVIKMKTNKQGKVVFKRHPTQTATWQAKFKGKKVGQHPKRYNCLPSKSKKKKVTVT